LEDIIKWLLNNKEWLFSGAGLFVLIWIGRAIYYRKKTNSSQGIRSGSNSTNIQAGGDIKIGSDSKYNDLEK